MGKTILFPGGSPKGAGFGGFLQKPFRRQDLGKKLRELLGVSSGSAAE